MNVLINSCLRHRSGFCECPGALGNHYDTESVRPQLSSIFRSTELSMIWLICFVVAIHITASRAYKNKIIKNLNREETTITGIIYRIFDVCSL